MHMHVTTIILQCNTGLQMLVSVQQMYLPSYCIMHTICCKLMISVPGHVENNTESLDGVKLDVFQHQCADMTCQPQHSKVHLTVT